MKAPVRALTAVCVTGIVSATGCLRPEPPQPEEVVLDEIATKALAAHVERLAGDIGERNVFVPAALAEAEDYIGGIWREQGYQVRRQAYEVHGVDSANLEITRRGTERADEIVLLGAHYDSVAGSPGANDNASGVAALLELSRVFANRPTRRTLRFVAFVNEEPPFFATRRMGSSVYAHAARRRGDDIRLMISIETIGYSSDEPRSQRYPPLFRYFYPDRGHFVAFVSNLRSRRELGRTVAAFRAHSEVPVEHAATFAFVPGVSWSDHLAFWRQGYRALMVTDTAPYRYPHYHTWQDTPDKLDYDFLRGVTEGLAGAVAVLAGD